MQRLQNLLSSFVFSRKFWIFIGGVVTFITAATSDGVWTPQETKELIWLFIGYIGSIAFEDGMSARVNWNSLAGNKVLVQPEGGATATVQESVNTTTTVRSEPPHA